jgi:hypothetical protein
MTVKDHPWQKVEARDFLHQQRKTPAGEITLSPHDIPEAVRAFYDQVRDALMIQFRYFGEHEKYDSLTPKNGVDLKVGALSGRLYEIKISRHVAKELGISQLVNEAIQTAANNQTQWRLVENLNVARQIAAKHERELQKVG